MRISSLALVLTAAISACTRSPYPPPISVKDDTAIAFPQFFEHEAIAVGTQGETYALDGELLKALTIASDDLLPPRDQPTPCHRTREAQFYRVIRQQNVIFVYIHENHAYCGRRYPALDSGAKYAISTNGRILRRVLDGQEGGPFDTTKPQASDGGFIGEPGSSPAFDALWNPPPSEPKPQDGGTRSPAFAPSPPAPSHSDGDIPEAP